MKSAEFDKKLKSNVQKAEQKMAPAKRWDIEKSWQAIMDNLNQTKGSAMYWYLALAASVSVVCAGGLSLQSLTLPDIKYSEPLPVEQVTIVRAKPNTDEVITTANTYSHELSRLYPRKESSLNRLRPAVKFNPLVQNIKKEAFKKTNRSPRTSYIKPTFRIGASSHKFQMSPELYLKKNVSNNHLIDHLGISVEPRFGLSPNHSENNSYGNAVHWSLFVNAVIGNQSAGRPWLIKMGYAPVHSGNRSQNPPAFKVNYQIQVRKNWYVGPELILTNGFKKAYPAITLSFG